MLKKLRNIPACGKLTVGILTMPKLRAKDDPYGLAPIRVTEAESKPSTKLARLPSAGRVTKSSIRAAFAVLVSLISALIGKFSRNRMPSHTNLPRHSLWRIGEVCLPRQGEKPWPDSLLQKGCFNEGLIPGIYSGERPSLFIRSSYDV